MSNKKHIVAIGISGFPYGIAPTQKLKMMGRAIVENGDSFFVLCNSYMRKTVLNKNLKMEGVVDGIKYMSTTPVLFTPDSIIRKIYSKVVGKINELAVLYKLKRKKEMDAVMVYSGDFLYAVMIGVFLRILHIPSYLIYFELRSSQSTRTQLFLKLNDRLFDRFTFYFFTGCFTISEFLIEHVKKIVPKKPYLYVPPIVDFNEFELTIVPPEVPYFLFCGSLAYYEVIEFILHSYQKVNNNDIKLFLVVGGNDNDKFNLKKSVENLGLDYKVSVFSNIRDTELKRLYVNAKALLIPLRNTEQDIARFPHKIAEYCAAGRPIVSTRFGEVANIFDDSSAILADDYDEELYAEKLQFTIDNPEACELIALNGYLLGKKRFNYASYSKPIMDFMLNRI